MDGRLAALQETGDEVNGLRRQLMHGNIMHGKQYLRPDLKRSATSYYSANSGIDSVGAWGMRMVFFIHHYTPEQITDKVVLRPVSATVCLPTPTRIPQSSPRGALLH